MSTTIQPDIAPSYAFHRDPQPIDDLIVTHSVLAALSSLTEERNQKLGAGQSVREVNEEYVREYAEYLGEVTGQDAGVIYRQVSASLATSGKESSATLMQLVVGARVYRALGIRPATGVFSRGGMA